MQSKIYTLLNIKIYFFMNCYCCIVIALVEKGDTPFVSLKKVVYATHPDAPDQLKSSSVLRSTHKIAFKRYVIRYVNAICSYSSPCLLTHFVDAF